ncbi:hypothetical protein KY285_026079 [Solanum tuberosum]|nr:hypothetical protein KY285_026079 [Solanum tuberosum]
MTSAYDILASLKEMFGEQNCAAKQTAMKALLTTKMAEGSSVREHVLKLMNYLNELEILGAEIDKESQVEMILQTLPDSWAVLFKTSKIPEEKKKPRKTVTSGGAKDGVAKPKGKCFHCKQPGHYKKQCPDFQAKMKNKGVSGNTAAK